MTSSLRYYYVIFFQGLAMRDHIFLPKPKGVKKGWIRHIGAISQNRFLVFPFSEKVNRMSHTYDVI